MVKNKEKIIKNCPYIGKDEECIIMTTIRSGITIKRKCKGFIYCSQKVEMKNRR